MKELTPELKPRWNTIITDVLREFISICKENHLTYFCSGGTALGAVRHKGIIPWDDDIDVNMPRPDYDKFFEICQTRDMGNYQVVTPYNTSNYPLHFCKLCNRNTTLVEDADTPCLIGLYIDIFPLDGTCDNIDEAYLLMRHYSKLKNRLQAISTHNAFLDYMKLLRSPKEWGRFVYKAFGFFFRKYYRKYLLKKMEAICRQYDYQTSKNVILYSGGYGRRDIYPKEWFNGTAQFSFEGMEVDLPASYDDYLRHLFDDYMQLPPKEQRTSKHTKAYFNLDERETLSQVRKEIHQR